MSMRPAAKYRELLERQFRSISLLKQGFNVAKQDVILAAKGQDGRKNKFYGHRVKLLRTFYGLSTADVGAALEMTGSHASQIEQNTTIPTETEVEILALFFGVDKEVFSQDKIYLTITEQNQLTIM